MVLSRVVCPVSIAATGAAIAACSHCGSDDSGGPDASIDAREARAVSDRAAPEADVPEADPPDAPDSDWPGWRRIPALQVFNCPLDVAIDPAAVVPAIKWIPCTDGRPNCEEMDGTLFSPEVIKFPNGWFSADGRAFMLAHFIQSNIIAQYSIYDAKTLAPLAAWRGRHGPSPFCDAHVAFTETKMGVLYATSLDGGPLSQLIDVNTPMGLMTKPALLALSAAGDTSSGFAVSDTTFAFDMNLSESIVRGLTGTSTLVRTNWPYQLNTPIVVGDDVYAVNQHGTGDGWYREARIVADASVSILREAPQRHVTGMVTDGNDCYWAKSYGSSMVRRTQPRYLRRDVRARRRPDAGRAGETGLIV